MHRFLHLFKELLNIEYNVGTVRGAYSSLGEINLFTKKVTVQRYMFNVGALGKEEVVIAA